MSAAASTLTPASAPFAKAGGSLRKFVAATLDLQAMVKAQLQAQAQFPLDLFGESGAICRLSGFGRGGHLRQPLNRAGP